MRVLGIPDNLTLIRSRQIQVSLKRLASGSGATHCVAIVGLCVVLSCIVPVKETWLRSAAIERTRENPKRLCLIQETCTHAPQ